MVEIGMPMLALDQTWSRRRAQHALKPLMRTIVMDRKFIDEVVDAHNVYRSRHQVLPLSHSRELSQTAQRWAEQLAATNSFQHSNSTHRGESLGENIAMKWSSRPDSYTGQEVTDQWYSEIKMYTFGGEPRNLNSGHFTQVVWKGSREIGVGKATTRDGKIIVVANYLPAGNMLGEYSQNVLAPKDGKTSIPQTQQRDSPSTNFSTRSNSSSYNNNNIRSFGSDSGFGDFDEMRKNFFGRHSGGDGGFPSSTTTTRQCNTGGEKRSKRVYTVTEGSGSNKVTKIIEEETITKPNGETVTNRKESIKKDEDNGGGSNWTGFNRSRFDSGLDNFGTRLQIVDNDGLRSQELTKHSKPIGRNTGNSSSSSSSSDSSPESSRKPKTMSEFMESSLKHHNKVRAKHGVAPLKLSKDLSAHAQKWAEHLASSDSFQHSQCTLGGERIGENIACKWSSGGGDYSSQEVVDQWYGEISKHDYNSERSLGTGHFTQVVWKGSKELGIGKAKAAGGKIIVVANYRPAGNMIGQFRQNVFPPK